MFQVQIGSRQTVTNVSLQPWIAIKGSGSRQISHEKAHTKKANSHKEARKGKHFDNKLETYPTNFMSNDGYLTSFFSHITTCEPSSRVLTVRGLYLLDLLIRVSSFFLKVPVSALDISLTVKASSVLRFFRS